MAQDDIDGDGSGLTLISTAEYERLVERDDFLTALEAAGVDNWEGYSAAYRILRGEEEW